MSDCTNCGMPREPQDRFCTGCGQWLGDEPTVVRHASAHSRPGPEPPVDHWTSVAHDDPITATRGHGPAWYVALVGVVALLLVGVVLGVGALSRGLTGEDGDPAATASPAAGGEPVPSPSTDVAGTEQGAPARSLEISVSDSVAQHELASEVTNLLSAYQESINSGDYSTYISLFTPSVQTNLDLTQVAEDYSTTWTSDFQLTYIEELADGRTASWVDFVSTQASSKGPDGQTCTRWSIGLFLERDSVGLAIGSPPEDYQAFYEAC